MAESFSLTLILSERNPAHLEEQADRVSDPSDAFYGHYWDRTQLATAVALPTAERCAVAEWLADQGMRVQPLESAGQVLLAEATAAQVEKVFGRSTRAWLQQKEEGQGQRLRLALPRRLAGYLQKVEGILGKGRYVTLGEVTEVRPGCATADPLVPKPMDLAGMTPADIADLYHFPATWDGQGETIALMMLGGELVARDLHSFWRAHDISPPEVKLVRVGPTVRRPVPPLYQREAAMTVAWAGAMAPGATIVVYCVDPLLVADPWAAFLLAVIQDQCHCPTVACTSWMVAERRYYAQHGHSVIMGLLSQAALLGITVIAAAGNWGALDGIPRTRSQGYLVSGAPWPRGIFPAVETRVLAVGGTMIRQRHPLVELGWSGPPPPDTPELRPFDRLAGSGGFSDHVPIPAWQKPVLQDNYPRGREAPSVAPYGRGFPDVALMAAGRAMQQGPGESFTLQGYQAVVGGQWIDYAGGTSVAAPIWAAILARANQARRSRGQPRLGFVNPLLYQLHRAQLAPLRPITSGAADVSITVMNAQRCPVPYEMPGYLCQPGWNPVTGLGVPHVTNLLQLLCTM